MDLLITILILSFVLYFMYREHLSTKKLLEYHEKRMKAIKKSELDMPNEILEEVSKNYPI